MISHEEKEFINQHAYIPEHITDYVVAISETEPFLYENHVFYVRNDYLIFIGYPLKESFTLDKTKKVLFSVIDKFRPKTVAFIGPEALIPDSLCVRKNSDHYYILELSNFHITSKLKNSISRASREVILVNEKRVTNQHCLLIDEVIEDKKVDEYTEFIFKRIPAYLESSSTAQIFSAYDHRGNLVGFDIADYQSSKFCFYMFNFISRSNYVPGVSDLLFYEIIKKAKEMKKNFVNMGLGINEGVVFFKEKWGGKKFLAYEFCLHKRKSRIIEIFDKILKRMSQLQIPHSVIFQQYLVCELFL